MDKIYNPETKRYVKRDSKKGIEILFKNKDKEILKSFELVKGNIIKKCPENKIRNPKTLRCVNKKVNKKSNSLSRKINAINKIKKAFSPFVKRVSADIYTRVRYLMMIRRELKKVLEEGKGCLKIYKENPDGTFKYCIGSHIILNKRIGTPSAFGEAYLSEFREKSKKLLTFVSKISKYDNEKTSKELEILELLTNKVRIGKCPHFPITYGYVSCDKLYESDNFLNYPVIIKKNLKNKILTLFNELANGDFNSFIKTYQYYDVNIFLNSLVQIYLSIISFYYHTDMIHNDCHCGNFLYHKIKKGGYFHYKIFDEDYYLENIGFLWVIWDFEFARKIKNEITYNDKICYNDFQRFVKCFLFNIAKVTNMDDLFQIIHNFLRNYIYKQQTNFTYQNLMNFIIGLIQYFKDNQWLLTKIPSGSKIINKEPYVIGKDFLSRY
jgi:hypothetical protein